MSPVLAKGLLITNGFMTTPPAHISSGSDSSASHLTKQGPHVITHFGIAGHEQGVGSGIQNEWREEGDRLGSRSACSDRGAGRESVSLNRPQPRGPAHPPAYCGRREQSIVQAGLPLRPGSDARPREWCASFGPFPGCCRFPGRSERFSYCQGGHRGCFPVSQAYHWWRCFGWMVFPGEVYPGAPFFKPPCLRATHRRAHHDLLAHYKPPHPRVTISWRNTALS